MESTAEPGSRGAPYFLHYDYRLIWLPDCWSSGWSWNKAVGDVLTPRRQPGVRYASVQEPFFHQMDIESVLQWAAVSWNKPEVCTMQQTHVCILFSFIDLLIRAKHNLTSKQLLHWVALFSCTPDSTIKCVCLSLALNIFCAVTQSPAVTLKCLLWSYYSLTMSTLEEGELGVKGGAAWSRQGGYTIQTWGDLMKHKDHPESFVCVCVWEGWRGGEYFLRWQIKDRKRGLILYPLPGSGISCCQSCCQSLP